MNINITEGAHQMKTQTVTFNDLNPSYTYSVDSSPDATYATADMSDVSLQEFFARPVRIRQFDWGTGTTLTQTFEPWADFFNNKRVINRINNYSMMRAKLHVKFVINGNGFHYGRLLASYNPLNSKDDFIVTRSLLREDLVEASQRPHIFLDPTTSSGGQLDLPFLWYYDFLNITADNYSAMGQMRVQTMQGLKHANGAADTVSISVFAWATDVTLAGPTSTNLLGLVPQMGRETDEYGVGPVSRPASIVARVAGALRNTPVIAPYALATQLAASAVSKIATAFGYSRAPTLAPIHDYKPVVLGNMANVNMPDSVVKLSLDAKQELSVDSRTVGLNGDDEMDIAAIASRQSFLDSFDWKVTDGVDTPLFSTKVTPMVWNELNASGTKELHVPACCFAAMPFYNWRGTMRYRFQAVCSNYHKGRLKIVYEPYFISSSEFNTNYTYIVDLAESKDFTIDVGWCSHTKYCVNKDPPSATSPIPYVKGAVLQTISDESFNGIISVYVVNNLTVPNTSIDNDIEINCFVSAAPDFEVRNPRASLLNNYSVFKPLQATLSTPQMGEETADVEETDEPNKPLAQLSDMTMAAPMSCSDPTNHVFFGEDIKSIRSLMKRYTLHYTDAIYPAARGYRIWTRICEAFPFYRGASPNGINVTSLGPFNFSNTTYLNWFTPAYVGWRGGIRYKTSLYGPSFQFGTYSVTREETRFLGYSSEDEPLDPGPLFEDSKNTMIWSRSLTNPATMGGSHFTTQGQNPNLEFEIPFQTTARFHLARSAAQTTPVGSNADRDFASSYTLKGVYRAALAQSEGAMFQDIHVAAGEDFSLFMFVGCPILYEQSRNVALPP